MKTEKRNEAIRMRRQDGVSVREIARRLDVSKGSVSRWVRGVELTEEQLVRLDRSMIDGCYRGRAKGAARQKIDAEARRDEWMKKGASEADVGNWLHVAGCMLYWAEGHRRNNRHAVCFANSDMSMMVLFLRFLRRFFEVGDDRIAVSINCYTDVHGIEEIESFWLMGLGLPRSCLRKSIVDRRPACTQGKAKGVLPYGTCKMVVNDVEILYRIYGAIEKYGKEGRR